MSSVAAPVTGTRAIHRVNPVAKLTAALVLSITLLFSVDWVSASVALALELVLFCWAGVPARTFFARTWPVIMAAPLAGLTTLLYGQQSGRAYWDFLLIHVTEGSVQLGLATCLRVLAIGLAGVVLFITIDPTDLADGLGQIVKLPARFVLGSLAAMRLVGLLIDDWRSLELARRARGVGDSSGIGGNLKRWLNQAFSLLVLSIRRGSKLATAMEARGFGAATERSWARESVFAARDWMLIAIAVLVSAAAVTSAVWAGQWNFIFS